MACLIAPAAAATIISVVKKKAPAKYHIDWLLLMLWGGVLTLIIEHIANKEIVPSFPFFTSSWSEIRSEILHVGLTMTLAILTIWAIMISVINYHMRTKNSKETVILSTSAITSAKRYGFGFLILGATIMTLIDYVL